MGSYTVYSKEYSPQGTGRNYKVLVVDVNPDSENGLMFHVKGFKTNMKYAEKEKRRDSHSCLQGFAQEIGTVRVEQLATRSFTTRADRIDKYLSHHCIKNDFSHHFRLWVSEFLHVKL